MLKEELEAIIKSDNIWAGRSTLILVIGILGEYVVLPFFEKKEMPPDANAWFTSRRPPQCPPRRGLFASLVLWLNLSVWKSPSKIFFAFLVVTGIAGEYEFSSRIARNADKLQQISDQDLTDATNTASAAIDRATTASRENFRLGKHIEAERQKTALIQKDSATLRKQAEDEKLARVEVELSLASLKTPRMLRWNDDDRREFTSFAGTPYLVAVFEDKESIELASSLVSNLALCGWVYKPPPNMSVSLMNRLFAPSTLDRGVHTQAFKGQFESWGAVHRLFTRSGIRIDGTGNNSPADVVRPEEQIPMQIIIGQRDLYAREVPPTKPIPKAK